MTVAKTVEDYLAAQEISYDVVAHPHASTSMTTAQAAHIPGDSLAKAVLLRDSEGFLLAVIPATHHLELDAVGRRLGHDVEMATENDMTGLFEDCDLGAIPPLGLAYGLRTLWDEKLADNDEIFFEGGDHRHVVQVGRDDFTRLMAHADKVTVSHHV